MSTFSSLAHLSSKEPVLETVGLLKEGDGVPLTTRDRKPFLLRGTITCSYIITVI